MATPFYLLLLIGHLGAFDVLYFHTYRCKLHLRPECQREVFWHTIRHLVYASQFIILANLRFHGMALLVLAGVFACDVVVAWSDVWEETVSRKEQGGLPRGEYFMHVVLSVLVGGYIALVAHTAWPDRLLPTAIVVDPPPVPLLLRMMMTSMGIVAIGFFTRDIVRWARFPRVAPPATEVRGGDGA